MIFLYSSYWLSLFFPQNTFYILLLHSMYITTSHLFFVYMEAISKANPIFTHKEISIKIELSWIVNWPRNKDIIANNIA